MSNALVKRVSLKATAEMDVSGFKAGLASFKSIRRQLEQTPIKVPLKLDLSGIRSDAARAAAEYRKAFSAGIGNIKPPGSSTSKGGIFLPPGATAELAKFREASGKEIKRIETDINNGKGKIIQSFEQLAKGIERVTTTSVSPKGKKSVISKIIDTTPVKNLQSSLDKIDRDFGSRIGSTKAGKGDLAAVLTKQKEAVEKAINEFGALEGTSEWRRANRLLDSLDRRIADSTVKQDRAATQDTRKSRVTQLKDALAGIEAKGASAEGQTKGSKGDMAAFLATKRQAIEAELSKFKDIADSNAFRSAQSKLTAIDKQIGAAIPRQAQAKAAYDNRRAKVLAQRDVSHEDRALQTAIKQNKADESAARAIRDRAVREREINSVLDERERLLRSQADRYDDLAKRARVAGHGDAADKYQDAGRRQRNDLNQVGLDRIRESHSRAVTNQNSDMERQISRQMESYRLDRERLNNEERLAKKIASRSQREEALNGVLGRRKMLARDTYQNLSHLGAQANSQGNTALANRAEGNRNQVLRQGVRDLGRLSGATRNSGHAFDFHTNSLIKNAATFTKWYIPAQAAMGAINGLTSGLSGAVRAERSFKVLEAVFRGSTEEAKRLATQTLALAAANGRGSDEAAQSAIAWARLGFTRTQILMAMETSLRAANVAEISTGEATEYLTATYKAFNLTISDIPATLDYLNALSNRYNVTNKDLFEGISRTSNIAKQAGLDFEDLAGIITVVTAATGRPGQEIGNAMKFIINRTRTPEVMKNLKSEFGIDITNASGDVKKFSEILADLAGVYPSLSRLEKARLNDIVSGARQGNRFAIVMESYTDSLIAQAKAGFDANSAMRENSNILESVDSQMQAVTTSFTALVLAVGKNGAFDALAQTLHTISGGLTAMADGTEKALNSVEISDRTTRTDAATFLGDRKPFVVSKRSRSREEIEEIIKIIKTIEGTAPTGGEFLGSGFLGKEINGTNKWAGLLRNKGRSFFSPDWDQIDLKEGETWADKRRQFEALIASDDNAKSKSSTQDTGKNIIQSQNRVTSMLKAEQAFKAMARDSVGVGTDPQIILKQFDDAVELLEHLPGGLQNVANARLQIRPLLESGRYGDASAALSDVSARFKDAGHTEFEEVEAARQKAIATTGATVEETRKRLASLNQTMAKESDAAGQKAIQTEIQKTTDLLKEQEETLRTLTRGFEKPPADPLSGMKDQRISDYFADLKLASEAMGGLMEGFGNTGFSDLDAKLKIGSARMYGDLVEQSLDASRAQNSGRMDALRSGIAVVGTSGLTQEQQAKVEAMREELALHEAIDKKLGLELASAREASAEAERKLELGRQAAKLQEAYDDGAAGAAARAGAYAIGQSEGERLVNQTRGAMFAVNGPNMVGAIHDPWLGTGDNAQDARELGALTQNLAASKQGILSMENRMNTAIAERANLEITISEEQRKQREEASKRLAMASREDQLRAAGAAAVLKARGTSQFSMEEFSFFSQETRGALSNLSPYSVKGLDDSDRDTAESRGKLDDEIKLLAVSIATMRKQFDDMRPYAESVAGGLVNSKGIGGTASGQRVTDLNQSETRVNLNMGDVRIDLDMARHVGEIRAVLQERFDARLDSAMAALRRELSGPRFSEPNTTPANSTF